MKLYKDNLTAGEYDMPATEVALAFLASRFEAYEWPLDRSLPVFIGTPEPDGLASSYDSRPGYDEVYQEVCRLRRAAEQYADRLYARSAPARPLAVAGYLAGLAGPVTEAPPEYSGYTRSRAYLRAAAAGRAAAEEGEPS
jgi:hypothetical protein